MKCASVVKEFNGCSFIDNPGSVSVCHGVSYW
jgi:hypothetical protein